MQEARFAEDANYWTTSVSPFVSQGEIYAMLKAFSTEGMIITQGQTTDGREALLVRFGWLGESYRFAFIPLKCREPEKTRVVKGEKRSHGEQAVYQMCRIAMHGVKAILTIAESTPAVLAGFKELPGVGHHDDGLPYTMGELSTHELTAALPLIQVDRARLLTGSEPAQEDVVDGEFTEA